MLKKNLDRIQELEVKDEIIIAMMACDGVAGLKNYRALGIVHGAVLPENLKLGIEHNNVYLIGGQNFESKILQK